MNTFTALHLSNNYYYLNKMPKKDRELRAFDLFSILTYLSRVWSNLIISFIFLPFSLGYFLYIHIPLLICSLIWGYFILFIHVICKKSHRAKHLVIHASAFLDIGKFQYIVCITIFDNSNIIHYETFAYYYKLTIILI